MKVLLVTRCIWWSEWCGTICVSSMLRSLVQPVCEMANSTIHVSCSRHTIWHVLKPVCYIYMCCWRTRCCQCYFSGKYSSMVLVLFSFGVDLFLFELGSCWLLWLNTSFNILWKILFWSWEKLVQLTLYRFYLNFVFITNMYSFGSYLSH